MSSRYHILMAGIVSICIGCSTADEISPKVRIECEPAHDNEYKYLNRLFDTQLPEFSVGNVPGGKCVLTNGDQIYPVLLFNEEFLTNNKPEYSAEILFISSNNKIIKYIPGASSNGGATERPCEAQYIESNRLHCLAGMMADEEVIIDLQ